MTKDEIVARLIPLLGASTIVTFIAPGTGDVSAVVNHEQPEATHEIAVLLGRLAKLAVN